MSLCPQTGSLKLVRDMFNEKLREGWDREPEGKKEPGWEPPENIRVPLA